MNRLKGIDPFAVSSIVFNPEERAYLQALADSPHAKDRRLCLNYLDACLHVRNNLSFNLHLLECLTLTRGQIRWAAFYLMGHFVEEHPTQVWPLVVKYGSVASKAIRESIAACLLEHMLEYHFDQYMPKVERLIQGGNHRFVYTLYNCLRLGQSNEQWARVTALLPQDGPGNH